MVSDTNQFVSALRGKAESIGHRIEEKYGLSLEELGAYKDFLSSKVGGVSDPEIKSSIEGFLSSLDEDKDVRDYNIVKEILSYPRGPKVGDGNPQEKGEMRCKVQEVALVNLEPLNRKEEIANYILLADAVSQYIGTVDSTKSEDTCLHIIQRHAEKRKLTIYSIGGNDYVDPEEFSMFLRIECMEKRVEERKTSNKRRSTINDVATLLRVRPYFVKDLLRSGKIKKDNVEGRVNLDSLQKYLAPHPFIDPAVIF